MAKLKIKWNSERVLSISAMAISFITLIIFIYQTNLMRRQNHLSIMPYLMLSTTNDSGNSTFEINLKNHGVGPAIIESVAIAYRGKRYDLTDYENHLYTLLSSLEPALDSLVHVSYGTLDRGIAIPANTTYNVLAVREDQKDFQLISSVFKEMVSGGLDYEIVYKSIQDERWVIHDGSEGPERLD